MVKKKVERDFRWRTLVVLIGIVVLAWFVFQVFFGYEDCKTKACFNDNLKGCNRATFVNGEEMIFEYSIEGRARDKCEVVVELLQGELNNADSEKLEHQKMICMLPLNVVMDPESDIGACHGEVKEGLQDLIIRNLHTYLVQNLGKLNLEMLNSPLVKG